MNEGINVVIEKVTQFGWLVVWQLSFWWKYTVLCVRFVIKPQLTHCDLVTPYGDTSGSTLAHVMACCLTAQSHFLNQYWPIIKGVLWHSFGSYSTRSLHKRNPQDMFRDHKFKIITTSLSGPWANANFSWNSCLSNSYFNQSVPKRCCSIVCALELYFSVIIPRSISKGIFWKEHE